MLDADEMHHCIHVLRHKAGDTVHVTDGKGALYLVKLESISKSGALFNVISNSQLPDLGDNTGIAFGLTKSMDRMEWFVEKAVELGISHIYFYQSHRSERSKLNLDKIQKTAVSAMKQARHGHLPEIQMYASLKQLTQGVPHFDHKFIAICHTPAPSLSSQLPLPGSKIVIIGPEGDFTSEEITHAVAEGYREISMGNTILRAETAGIVASSLIKLC